MVIKQIVDHVFIGDASGAKDFINVDGSGNWANPYVITGVINCTGTRFNSNEKEVQNFYDVAARDRLGITFDVEYIWLGLNERTRVTREMANNIISFIDRHVKASGNVLVHCQAGLQRSPSIVLVYLLSLRMSFFEALHLIEDRRENAICPTAPMLQSIARLQIDGRRVTGLDIHRFVVNRKIT